MVRKSGNDDMRDSSSPFGIPAERRLLQLLDKRVTQASFVTAIGLAAVS